MFYWQQVTTFVTEPWQGGFGWQHTQIHTLLHLTSQHLCSVWRLPCHSPHAHMPLVHVFTVFPAAVCCLLNHGNCVCKTGRLTAPGSAWRIKEEKVAASSCSSCVLNKARYPTYSLMSFLFHFMLCSVEYGWLSIPGRTGRTLLQTVICGFIVSDTSGLVLCFLSSLWNEDCKTLVMWNSLIKVPLTHNLLRALLLQNLGNNSKHPAHKSVFKYNVSSLIWKSYSKKSTDFFSIF